MSIHYKFKNTINYDAIKFDGICIAARDLKNIIEKKNSLANSILKLENEETGQTYSDDELIPKNTNLVISRLPFSTKRTRPTAKVSGAGTSSATSGGSDIAGGREAMELVSTKNMSEEEKIKYIQSQSTKDFDVNRYARGGRGGGGHNGRPRGHFVPGPGYTCRKCNIPGHSIYDCKASSIQKVKRSSGIPRDFLIKVDSKEKGALMTPSGEYAVPRVDREAYSNPKMEKGPFFDGI